MNIIDFLLEQKYQVMLSQDAVVLKSPDGKTKTIKHEGDYDSAIHNWVATQEMVGVEITAITNHVKYLLDCSAHVGNAAFEYKGSLCLVGILKHHWGAFDRTKITVQTNMRVLDESMFDPRLEELILALREMDCGYDCTVNKLPTIVGGTYRFECVFTRRQN